MEAKPTSTNAAAKTQSNTTTNATPTGTVNFDYLQKKPVESRPPNQDRPDGEFRPRGRGGRGRGGRGGYVREQ